MSATARSGHALLIGAELDGLVGVATDLDVMTAALTSRGLAVTRCAGADATRAGILAAYQQLIGATQPDDLAVVYYSGHGGFVTRPEQDVSWHQLLDMQFIAPIDYHRSRPGDFRGIAAVELSVLLARLTERTNNAVVVLDCCHAAHMSRDDGPLRARALSRLVPYDDMRDHLDRLRDAGRLRTDLLTSNGNRNAVRVVACAPDQLAYEYRNRDGLPIGILTDALVRVLHEAGDEQITWATAMEGIRRLAPAVLRWRQRPEVEGPARRLLFGTVEDDPLTTLPATPIPGGRVRLECAPLLGVRHGDTFSLMPAGRAVVASSEKVGDLVVDEVEPLAASGAITLHNGWMEVPLGARAHRTSAVAPGMPVRLPWDDPRAVALVRAVTTAPMLWRAESDDWLAEVSIGDSGALTVSDRVGPVTSPRLPDPVGIAQVVRDLTTLARAEALRDLAGDEVWALHAPVTVEWGMVRDGRRRPLTHARVVVPAGAEVYVSIRNDGVDPVYVSIIDIGVTGAITVLTPSSRSGMRLTRGASYVYGYDEVDRVLTGMALTWPDGLDPGPARPETVLLLVTSAPQDVSVLEQDGARRATAVAISPLQRMLDQIASGHVRPVRGLDPIVRYDLHAIDFTLDPLGAAVRQ
jgi:hypothetical protein